MRGTLYFPGSRKARTAGLAAEDTVRYRGGVIVTTARVNNNEKANFILAAARRRSVPTGLGASRANQGAQRAPPRVERPAG